MSPANATDIPDDETLDRVFRALGDPTRRAIVSRLTVGDATVGEIASGFDMSLPGVSKHVGVLEEAGLVHRWRAGRTRRCSLQVERLRDADRWLVHQTAFWSETLEALAGFVENEPGR